MKKVEIIFDGVKTLVDECSKKEVNIFGFTTNQKWINDNLYQVYYLNFVIWKTKINDIIVYRVVLYSEGKKLDDICWRLDEDAGMGIKIYKPLKNHYGEVFWKLNVPVELEYDWGVYDGQDVDYFVKACTITAFGFHLLNIKHTISNGTTIKILKEFNSQYKHMKRILKINKIRKNMKN